ncbi:EAL domain-containing protein [Janthinobacterium sp. SUN073]|uniref:EAL domain-containing protein n=1 Tax=Janthinobacterium sp. SUN073 TaxID=3004102 RepID=UPI0025B09CF0|nr:EAL domain-containing protein [Janthinobacterium sp. SUN073]MDN2696325.1 EAL domain-containing protein [Janthinobacterium sp. SUN073]
MRRKRIIVTSVLVAVIGVAAPLSLAFYLSSVRAEQGEQERLRLLAGYALERAHRSIASASMALRSADALDLVPCSEAHIQQLRRITITTRSIDDIGYVENGMLKCSSTGMEDKRIAVTPADFTLANGMGLDFNLRPVVSGGKRMVGLSYRAYKVLIDPVRFSDVIVDSDIQMAVAIGRGGVLDTLHHPDPALVQALLAGKPTADGSIHALLYRDGLTAVMIEPRSKLNDRLRREQLLLLPLGLLMAAFIVGIVIWLSRRRLSLMGELKIAIERREFFVHYQPIIALDTGVCVGAEALIRWRRPDGSMIRPDLFIPVAEDSDLILPITDQVIACVIADMGAALLADRELHIAINLCASDIETGRVLDVLERALDGTGIEAQQIWLEATERGFINVEAARATIDKARARGHAVAIDDFGTGYSSLSSLQNLPLDALKIDKSFVDTIGTDAATSSVTPHIIAMARTLNMLIVAEGIETQQQADYLRERKVEFGQGWLFAKALPAAEFLTFYRARRAPSST